LDGARLRAGEEEELRLERRRLQHAVRLVSGLDDVTSWLRDDPESATARLVRATRLLGDLARLDPECAGAVETLETAHAQLEDAWHLLRGLRERIVDEPGRLEAIDERLDALTRLKRKYGDTEDAMLVFRATAAEELQRLERYEEALVEAERAREERRARLLEDAMLLSERRLAAVRTLGEAVQRELRTLGMEQARFEIAVERGDAAACSASGIDRVEFRFSANLGEELRPLARIASGGELSRVMLALQTVVAGGRVPTMIFDEVDAGVGGRVAGVVGQKLAGLAGDRQVLCVTHWPQIAAHATRHLRVIKGVRGGRTRATVTVLDDAERIEELARMLGGGAPSEAARRHASELVARARQGVRTSRLYKDGRC
jgi:DNA repair protein RecN (Recombination protein N)